MLSVKYKEVLLSVVTPFILAVLVVSPVLAQVPIDSKLYVTANVKFTLSRKKS